MKTISSLQLFCFAALLLLGSGLYADIADDSDAETVSVHVQLMNGSKFPGYQFFVHYQSYVGSGVYGDYSPDTLSEMPLLPAVSQATSDFGDQSYIFARDSAGKIYQSSVKFGGTIDVGNPDFAYLIKQIEVVKIADGVIEVKLVATKAGVEYEEVFEMKKGGIGSSAQDLMRYALLPAICLLGLVAFFVVRRRQVSRG